MGRYRCLVWKCPTGYKFLQLWTLRRCTRKFTRCTGRKIRQGHHHGYVQCRSGKFLAEYSTSNLKIECSPSFQRIRLEAQIDAAHQGFFTIELCPQQTETNTCFQRLPVLASNNQVRDGTACVTMASQVIWAEVQLPAGVRCNRCTLRWTYRTAYPPGKSRTSDFSFFYVTSSIFFFDFIAPNTCFNPNPSQTFRNCADIRIQ